MHRETLNVSERRSFLTERPNMIWPTSAPSNDRYSREFKK